MRTKTRDQDARHQGGKDRHGHPYVGIFVRALAMLSVPFMAMLMSVCFCPRQVDENNHVYTCLVHSSRHFFCFSSSPEGILNSNVVGQPPCADSCYTSWRPRGCRRRKQHCGDGGRSWCIFFDRQNIRITPSPPPHFLRANRLCCMV